MKILINTVTNTQIYNTREQQEKEGVKEAELFNGTYTIKGQLFIPGQWVHVADDFDVKAYPYIKEAHVWLEEETKRVLTENGLNNIAQGIKDSYEQYSKAVPSISTDVRKYAPIAVSANEEPLEEEVKP